MRLEPTPKPDHVLRVSARLVTASTILHLSSDELEQALAREDKIVAVCGELAGDAKIGPLLAGLGVQELSMSIPSIVRVKATLHTHPMAYWQQLAHELLKAETAADMQLVLQSLP